MDLTMTLVTRLVEALETSASCSVKAVALAEQALDVNLQILAFHKANAGQLVTAGLITDGTVKAKSVNQASDASKIMDAIEQATGYSETTHVSQAVVHAAKEA